jgi:GTPase SAR1 family protein
LVFDITDKKSFEDVKEKWMGQVEQNARKDVSMLLIGAKSDLEKFR